jgi:hypothetical protein
VAGTVNLLLALFLGASFPAFGLMTSAALLGFMGIGVSLVLFMLALRHLGTARTGAYFSLAPFIGAVLALALLKEPVTLALVVAGLFMAFGLALHLLEQHEHSHLHEPLEHDHAHSHDQHHQHLHSGPVSEPHSHPHRHTALLHAHRHFPDLHHRHRHD